MWGVWVRLRSSVSQRGCIVKIQQAPDLGANSHIKEKARPRRGRPFYYITLQRIVNPLAPRHIPEIEKSIPFGFGKLAPRCCTRALAGGYRDCSRLLSPSRLLAPFLRSR